MVHWMIAMEEGEDTGWTATHVLGWNVRLDLLCDGAGLHLFVAADQTVLLQSMGPRSVEERLAPTLESARKELAKYQLQGGYDLVVQNSVCLTVPSIAKMTGWSLNFAIGAQVVLGALTTGVAAATSGHQVRLEPLSSSFRADSVSDIHRDFRARRYVDIGGVVSCQVARIR